ncbi:MAG: hypothetical protein OEW62_04040 [Candidatus Bathyarchaeota archaeon]|nr:hypothetical protein [Candidatus Bathyarchaeota archaeon]MDH5745486.1 hypothetical protein [Candidatus Bathyarchaeota archaeon]
MNQEEAINSVAGELRKPDSPLMVFKPVDIKESFFIGPTLIVAAALFFINAFGKGAKTALENRIEEYGKKITNWVLDKIEALFRGESEDSQIEKEDLKKSIDDLKSAAKKADKKALESAIEASEDLIVRILKDKGLTQKRASEIAKVVRSSVEGLIGS